MLYKGEMMDNGMMSFSKTCTVQSPSYNGRYHQKYTNIPSEVSCEYSVEISNDGQKPYINSGWVVFPVNTDVTNESVIMIEGMRAPIKSVKMLEDMRLHILRGIKVTLGVENIK